MTSFSDSLIGWEPARLLDIWTDSPKFTEMPLSPAKCSRTWPRTEINFTKNSEQKWGRTQAFIYFSNVASCSKNVSKQIKMHKICCLTRWRYCTIFYNLVPLLPIWRGFCGCCICCTLSWFSRANRPWAPFWKTADALELFCFGKLYLSHFMEVSTTVFRSSLYVGYSPPESNAGFDPAKYEEWRFLGSLLKCGLEGILGSEKKKQYHQLMYSKWFWIS